MFEKFFPQGLPQILPDGIPQIIPDGVQQFFTDGLPELLPDGVPNITEKLPELVSKISKLAASMNFFKEDIKVFTKEPIDINSEEIQARRREQPLYKFNKENPFDESTNWKELTYHYENGTLDYDYAVKNPIAVKFFQLRYPGRKLPSGDDQATLYGDSPEVDQVSSLTLMSNDIDELEGESCVDTPASFGETIKLKLASFELPTFDLKSPQLPEFKLPEMPDLVNNTINPLARYKKPFYLTTAAAAVLSTGTLVGTVVVCPPLAPVLMVYLLPISVVSSGVSLFKAKKALKKRRTKISQKLRKFKLKCSRKRS